MAAESPVALIYGFDGSGYIETTIRAGIAVPSGQPGFIALGSDGTNTRYLSMDSSGRVNINNIAGTVSLPTGAATEATLATLLTLAGFQARINTLGQKTMANSTPVVLASDQSAIPVSQSGSWTVTANAGTDLNTSALALDATLAKLTIAQGASLGSNTQALVGGSVTTAAPSYTNGQISPLSLTPAGLLRVDASGTTVTVSGTVNANQSGSPWNFNLQQINGNTTLTGNGVTGTGSQRVTIASDNTPFGVNAIQSGSWTVTSNQGTQGTHAQRWMCGLSDGSGFISPATDRTTAAAPFSVRLSDGSAFYDGTKTGQLPSALVGGRLDVNAGAWMGSTAPTVGQKAMASSLPVVVSSDQSNLPVNLTQVGGNTVVTGGTNGSQGVGGLAANGAAVAGNPVLIGGSDGTNARTLQTDTSGRLVVAPASANATKGFAAGEAVLATTTISAVRSTTYTEQSSNATRSIASASASDTSAGTGARTVRITYYTATMTGPFTTDVTLNGTTAVATSVSDICFIESIVVLTVGSTGSNVGILTLYVNNAGGGGTIWTVAATANQTKGAHHYCPTGKTCFITGLLIGIKGADTTSGFIRAKDPTSANAAETQISDVIRAPSSGQSFRSYSTPIAVTGPTRITVFVAPDSSSSRTYYGSFDYYEE